MAKGYYCSSSTSPAILHASRAIKQHWSLPQPNPMFSASPSANLILSYDRAHLSAHAHQSHPNTFQARIRTKCDDTLSHTSEYVCYGAPLTLHIYMLTDLLPTKLCQKWRFYVVEKMPAFLYLIELAVQISCGLCREHPWLFWKWAKIDWCVTCQPRYFWGRHATKCSVYLLRT